MLVLDLVSAAPRFAPPTLAPLVKPVARTNAELPPLDGTRLVGEVAAGAGIGFFDLAVEHEHEHEYEYELRICPPGLRLVASGEMPAVRPWYVIPILGLAGAGASYATTHDPIIALAFALCGAALAAAIRAFLGPALVGAIAATGGAAIGVIDLLAVAPHVRAALAGAAGLFALSELARARLPNASPLPAAGAALLAAVLDPSYVGLVAVSGVAWVIAPVPRPRGVIALPILGTIATVLAIVLACGHSAVWHAWSGHATAHRDVLATVIRAGDLVGPIAACAALAGIAICLAHGRLAAAAVASIVAVTAAMSLAGGFIAPAVPLVAALCAGIAIGRLAALVRFPVGQGFVGAAAGFVLAVVPVSALFT